MNAVFHIHGEMEVEGGEVEEEGKKKKANQEVCPQSHRKPGGTFWKKTFSLIEEREQEEK